MTTENLARFGHHPDPAIDFETEVGDLIGEAVNCDVWPAEYDRTAIRARIDKAMSFRVGGVETCVSAKQMLRELDATFSPKHGGAGSMEGTR